MYFSATLKSEPKNGPWLGKRDLEKAIGKTIMPASKEGQLNTNWTKRTSPPCVGFVGRESNVSLGHIKKKRKRKKKIGGGDKTKLYRDLC